MLFSSGRQTCYSFFLLVVLSSLCPIELSNSLQAQPTQPARADGDFYHPDQVQAIRLQVSALNLRRLKEALPERIYVPAIFRWRDQAIENVGVRYKGNSSSNPNQSHKRGFLIKFSEFNKGGRFLGLERIALDNGIQFGSLFSEQLITAILRELEIPASRCNFATLYLNDSYHGVYTNVERIDGTFVSRHFLRGGALYKNDEGGPGGDLAPFDPKNAPLNRPFAFEPKSKAATKDGGDILNLITKIDQVPAKRVPAMLERTIEVDSFLKTMAVMLFSGAFDQLTGAGPHNFYLYHNPEDGRWNYIPWDLDVGFADNAFGRVPVIDGWNAAWPTMSRSPSPLLERIIHNPELLARYRAHADEILERYFHPDILIPRLDELYERIRVDLAVDPFPHRRVTNPRDTDYESIVASIKAFIRRRYATARLQLDNPGPRPVLAKPMPRGGEPMPGTSTLGAPSDLRTGSVTAESVFLEWKDNADDDIGHVVQRADGAKGDEFRNHIGKPGKNSTTATDRNVMAGKTYRYRVYAFMRTPTGPLGTRVSKPITVRVPSE
jgi:spore coat protein CotH